MRLRHFLLMAHLALTVGLIFMIASAEPAAAHHCQDFSDCFASADAASDALLGLTFLGMLSMAIDFIPYVGTAKGVVEGVIGRDLLTGQRLTPAERLLGLIPGGFGKTDNLLGGARHLDEMAEGMDEMATGARHLDAPPPPRPPRPGSRAYDVGEDSAPQFGRGPFPNQMADRLERELARADAAGIRPITPAAASFDDVVNSGRLKWAITTDGELRLIPHTVPGHGEVPHSVLTRGDDVLAAGEADIAGSAGQYVGLDITPHSGHFQPSLESLEAAREAFARYGITFP